MRSCCRETKGKTRFTVFGIFENRVRFPRGGESAAVKTPTAVGAFRAFGLTFEALPGRRGDRVLGVAQPVGRGSAAHPIARAFLR